MSDSTIGQTPPPDHLKPVNPAQTEETEATSKTDLNKTKGGGPSLMILVAYAFMDTMNTLSHSMVVRSEQINYGQAQAAAALHINADYHLVHVNYENSSGGKAALGQTTYENNINRQITHSRAIQNGLIQTINTNTSQVMTKEQASANMLSSVYQMFTGITKLVVKTSASANITKMPSA